MAQVPGGGSHRALSGLFKLASEFAPSGDQPRAIDRLAGMLTGVATVRPLAGFAVAAKQGAQGAALIADGLAGGRCAPLVEHLRIREASGSVLDHLHVISPEVARRRLAD